MFTDVGEATEPRTVSESLAPDELAKRLRVVGIDFPTLDNLSVAISEDPHRTHSLSFNLFHDAAFTGIVERKEATFSGGHAFTGRVAEDPLGTMALVVNGETVVGTVRTPGATYRIRSGGQGRYSVSEIDTSRLPEPCGLPTDPHHPGGTYTELTPTLVD